MNRKYWALALVWALSLLSVDAQILTTTATSEQRETLARLTSSLRGRGNRAWQDSLTLLKTVVKRQSAPPEAVAYLLDQQATLENVVTELQTLPTPESLQPVQQALLTGYQQQSQALDLILQFLLTGQLTPLAQTQIATALKTSPSLLQEATAALSPPAKASILDVLKQKQRPPGVIP